MIKSRHLLLAAIALATTTAPAFAQAPAAPASGIIIIDLE